jgi:hypothetical protein
MVPAVINAGIAPQGTVDGTELTNPWGGGTFIIGDGSTFHIYLSNVPQDSCVRLLSSGLLSQGSINNIWTVAGTAAVPTTRQAPVTSGARAFTSAAPPDPAQAAAACPDQNNNIYMVIR